MNRSNETSKRKIKDPFFQVSENFFERIEIIDLVSKYGFEGVGIYLKISLMLLKNQGSLSYDWKYISSKKKDQKMIEDIINRSGLFELSADKTTYSSPIVTEQLTERGKISLDQSIRAKKRWGDAKITDNGQNTSNSNIMESDELNDKPQRTRLTKEEMDALDKIDGIKR